jgi:Icc-related predicted phosphoesterase
MRALVVCDIHEEDEAVIRLRGRMEKERFDHLLVCGDLSRNVSFAEDFLAEFPDAFVIPGNWDSKAAGEVLAKAKNYAHERRIELGEGLNIVGFGYSNISPFHTFGELPEDEIYRRMSALDADHNTLLMLHCPPKGYFDEVRGGHAGSEAILRAVKEKKPLAAFFGHIHDHGGTGALGRTTLIKVPAGNSMRGCAIEIRDGKIKADFVML